MTCTKCSQPIAAGQLYLPGPGTHVACPTPAEVARKERWS